MNTQNLIMYTLNEYANNVNKQLNEYNVNIEFDVYTMGYGITLYNTQSNRHIITIISPFNTFDVSNVISYLINKVIFKSKNKAIAEHRYDIISILCSELKMFEN